MAKISPYGIYRAFNLAGTAALDGGKLYTYEAGTSTPKPTYTDASGDTENANPVILDINGSARIWLDVGGYKFVLTDKNDVEQFTEDNIDGGGAAGFASQVITTSTGLTLTSTYQNTVIVCTQPVTLSLVSAGIAGDGYVAVIINRSSGNVTIAPDGAETINGDSSYIVYPNGAANIHTNGVEWFVSADGQKEMQDNEFRILGSTDITKKLAFEVDGLTTATTRVLTAQDVDGTIYVSGGTDIPIADGGTGASTAEAARTNLGISEFGYIYRLDLSNNVSDANNDIDIASGRAASDNGIMMVLASGLTKRLDAAWAAGSNQGGLDTGTKANSTWYHVFLIYNPTTLVVDALFSTSATSPTMPSGFTDKRRIGAVLTDVSGNLVAFYQSGDEFYWKTPVISYNGGGSTTGALFNVSTPLGVSTLALIYGTSQNTDSTEIRRVITSPNVNNIDPTTYANAGTGRGSLAIIIAFSLQVRTDTSSQLRQRSTVNAGNITVYTEGWVDHRGRI